MKGVSGYDQEREIEAVQDVAWDIGVVIFAPLLAWLVFVVIGIP